MSKRLQVLLPDQQMTEIQRLARRERVTVGEWVRRALREARERKSVRRGAEFSFLTADIDQMLREIERGYEA